jgi:hypothetical protein
MRGMDELGASVRKFFAVELTDLVPTLTLITLLVNRVGTAELHFAVIVLSVAGLVLPGLHKSPLLWFALAAVLGLRVLFVSHNLDNHGFLIAYWSLALACAFSLDDPRKAFATQARFLVGFCFLFATLWKVGLSSDYLGGDFFHLTFLNDWRFSSFTQLVGGLSEDALQENRALIVRLRDATQGLESVSLQTTRQLHVIAIAATWWTAFIESLVTVQFLIPVGWRLARYRDATLMIFAVTTYAIAPVMGFGWLLMILGIAQTKPEQGRTRLLYVLTCFVIAADKYVRWLDVAADALT